jgi:hypothetical protein
MWGLPVPAAFGVGGAVLLPVLFNGMRRWEVVHTIE